MRQRRSCIQSLALLVTLLFVCLPKIVQAGPLSSPLISSYNPPFAQENTWDKLQTFSAGLTVSGGNLIAPTIIGGTGTTSTLTLQSTSGVGAAGADIIFKVGNNGATEAMRILNSGNVGIGTTGPGAKLHLYAPSGALNSAIENTSGTSAEYLMGGSGSYIGYLSSQNLTIGTAATVGGAITAKVTLDTNGNVGIGTAGPASLLDLRAGDLTFSGANGQKYVQGRATELVAVGSGISTKATTIQIPADAIVYAVPVYVKTKPGGTATMTVTATTSGTAFQKGANISTNAGTSDPGTKNTPINYNAVAAQTVTFTFNVPTTDALGEIRVDIYYSTSTPPTS